MKILAIDTSTKFLSIAVTDDNRVLAIFNDNGDLKHSELLIPEIDKTLKKSDLKLKDIDGLAISIGPGSFTGLRIGVSTFKAINMALGTPIAAVPTLDAVAYNFIDEEKHQLCPVIDAKKGKIYSSFYKKTVTHRSGLQTVRLNRVTEYLLAYMDDLLGKIKEPTVVFGDATTLYEKELKKNKFIQVSDRKWYPKAEVVARLGLEKFKKRQIANPDRLVPMYLHSKYCQVTKSNQKPATGNQRA